MIVKTQLGTWMENERLAKGLTKGKISDMIGISVGQYSAYVAGKSVPRDKTLEKIAKAYEKPLEDVQAMLAPIAQDVFVAAEADTACDAECEGALIARLTLLEAKLDYAVKLLEHVSRA